MTRVIHTGDTHIGYRQYHSPDRRADFLDAFERVVADATEEGVDAVVHAGDLFHDRRPELPDLLGTLSALRELDDAGVPFLAVVGNHESARGGQWLDLFESLGLATRLGSDPVVVGETAFYGLDHVPASRRDGLDYEFTPHDAAHAALVSHGLFEPFTHGEWDTEHVLESATVDFDAMLLGDNHTADTAEVSGTWVTYCGSTERASASERDGRGYNLVTFGGDDGVDIRRRALDTRPFVFVDAELGPGEGVERVRDRVRERDVEGAVVVVEVTGEGDPVAPAAIEEFAAERGALIARVKDRREVESSADVSVDFADPDAAVRERVSDLGLSTVARDVDDVVRGDDADANVRDEVKRRLDERLDDPDAFLAATERASATDRDGTDDADDDTAEDDTDADEATDDGTADGAPADGAGGDAPVADPGEGDDADGVPADGTADGSDVGADADAAGTDAADRTDDDTQATMGEYR
ncbi:DNA double-strand break repair protein Mre11 [Candidatus Halobonum tyrrellensis]|uniref:DNA double-strand break repair protein Mre11 n=1 Tax=Candidatus Halobonum tyrrellensis G22 TaxID=1324957 RepID=V4HKF9_9EURY|nr:DNA double-strand break repair protein Mre11 [Candidatus Halobonum tyrrellensis]ESP88394.1 DNA double-strand break repair protein mre11 [Candidatus Halobonum tyrrellensis G22]